MKLRVARRSFVGARVVALRLEAPGGGLLPPFAPGDHVELTFRPVGQAPMTRCYSLVGHCPAEVAPDHYELGIQCEEAGRGGSRWLHAELPEDAVIEVSAPRSHFALDEGAAHRVLIGGGIGITPVLAMARYCQAKALSYELHFFCRERASAPFIADVEALTGGAVHIHAGLAANDVSRHLSEIVDDLLAETTVHVCGPAGLLEATIATAREKGLPDDRVRFERFGAGQRASDRPFTCVLSSGRRIEVGAQETLLGALHREGIAVMSSCGAGTCGTCLVAVLEGEIDHRDNFLSQEEKVENTLMCCCVSRAMGTEIVIEA